MTNEEQHTSDPSQDLQIPSAELQRKRAGMVIVIIALFTAFVVVLMTLVPSYVSQMREESATDAQIATTQPFYVLLIGSDSRKGTALYTGKSSDHAQVDQHADVMTLLRVDPTNHVLTFVTIPRDTQLEGDPGKINDSLLTGSPEKCVSSAERLTGVPIRYYFMTTFADFETLVTKLGGVRADVPIKLTVEDPATGKDVTITSGKDQLLNGSKALVLARARSEYVVNQDVYRQMNVRALEHSLITKATEKYTAEDVMKLYEVLKSTTSTDMDGATCRYLLADFITNYSTTTVYSCTGPFWNGGENADGLWVVPEDKQTWYNVMSLVDRGLDPSDIVPLPEFPEE